MLCGWRLNPHQTLIPYIIAGKFGGLVDVYTTSLYISNYMPRTGLGKGPPKLSPAIQHAQHKTLYSLSYLDSGGCRKSINNSRCRLQADFLNSRSYHSSDLTWRLNLSMDQCMREGLQ